ncbi:hypothetical protein ORI89_19130 [Sphingobacterium sp. UT-1RO-CII-1]|uniref:hypothetical protein n=1 Tax=Sphingobacterium sp. UT-1RO-CII-1 TaxID=2995225 RepID=UPI00227D2137|nr:hypothetical protein [Sphingobacterium sp. UT-1RO-CII-1]MCY4781768.1 hypothetical protein [Sphingobacterium sp. UT-1RO-CII-1]
MKLNKILKDCKQDLISRGQTGFISCICLTCGIRNNHSEENGYCQNGHDDWLEYRDVLYKNETFKRAMSLFRLGEGDLTVLFATDTIKQFTIFKIKEVKGDV